MNYTKWPRLHITRVSHGYVAVSEYAPRMMIRRSLKLKKKELISIKRWKQLKVDPDKM